MNAYIKSCLHVLSYCPQCSSRTRQVGRGVRAAPPAGAASDPVCALAPSSFERNARCS